MGLDMYLMKKTYVLNWDHMGPDERHEITVKKGGKLQTDIKPERISDIIERVAYWRKANAIHRWFVEKCQDGKDECQETYISREQLAELVSQCKQVLDSLETVEGDVTVGRKFNSDGTLENMTRPGQVVAQKQLAEKLLPTASGFFFGSTDYDEYYLEDLRDTVKQIEPLLTEGDGDFYYRASW